MKAGARRLSYATSIKKEYAQEVRKMITRRNEKGNVLVMAILMTAVLLLLCGAYMSMVVSEHNLTARLSHSITAINVAEAGVEEALWELKHNGSAFSGWSGTNPVSKTGDVYSPQGYKVGEYYVEVVNPSDPYPVVNAIGYIPTQAMALVERQVQVKVEAEYLHGKAAFGVNGVTMDSYARTDSYDSQLGDYNVGGNIGAEGDIATDAIGSTPPAISLLSNAQVNGDVWIGPGGDRNTDIDVQGIAVINGKRKRSSVLRNFPPVQGDAGLPDKGSLLLGGSDTFTISESGKYSEIKLNSNSILTIDSDATIYVTGGFHIKSNSQLHITNGATVTIYVDGSIEIDSNTQINNFGKDPTKFAIYATDTLTSDINFDSNSTLYGVLYARNADVIVNSNAHIYGAITGKTVLLDSNAYVHYDLALRTIGAPIGYEPIYWQEK
jgi:hypothetical protein